MKPKNQEQAVLRLLIDRKSMTPVKFVAQGLYSYTQRIGDLRKKLTIDCEKVPFKNVFGHASTHGKWTLPNKQKAEKLYRKLWRETK